MIVNAVAQGWEIIFQRAHEQLAMQLAWHWQPSLRPKRFTEVLAAISDHDNEQVPFHGKFHINEAGAPLDFTQEPFQHEQIEKVVKSALYKSRYIAVLISLHTQYLYTTAAKTDKKLATILEEQASWRKKCLKSLKISNNEADTAYSLLHWCDRCSLILCRRQLPEDERRLEVFKGPDGLTYNIWQRSDQSVGLDPWPFYENEITVQVEARVLEQLKYKNDTELLEALESALVNETMWCFRK